ncbi:YciI family protein [Nonomuraea aurantiaca]|uniref:YciI family protein n=1 Tax=Nonomuraea aurantiaca TaxID=2878562 RepID=UPI001CD98F78|nr:YciI family protein [Nonomuraea aurantiaca]
MGLPENAITVRVEGGRTLATDGPFVEMKEAVGGWFILEADNLDSRRPPPPSSAVARPPAMPHLWHYATRHIVPMYPVDISGRRFAVARLTRERR